MSSSSPVGARGGIAFLLAQLGDQAAEQFSLALSEHGLTPPLAGIMRILRSEPGLSQQQLAERLGMAPSRIVSFVDDLEARGWIERSRDSTDRRVNVLTVTPAGREGLKSIALVAREHEKRITAGLDDVDRARLLEILTRLVAHQKLAPGVHPGYRRL
ncbi:MarR family winged helix-turn-helix transcriptional regulator [Jatrophihabitans sp. DSM 45814]